MLLVPNLTETVCADKLIKIEGGDGISLRPRVKDVPKVCQEGIEVPSSRFSMHFVKRDPNSYTYLVGRLGLDPSTLKVFPERPPTSIRDQVCRSGDVECPPTSTEVQSRVNSWLDPARLKVD